MSEAYEEGYEAYPNVELFPCPYSPKTRLSREWHQGYEAARKEIWVVHLPSKDMRVNVEE